MGRQVGISAAIYRCFMVLIAVGIFPETLAQGIWRTALKVPGYEDKDSILSVEMNVALLSLELDSSKETLSVAVQFGLVWQSGLRAVVGNVPTSQIWTPDISIFNGVDDMRPAAWRRDYLVSLDENGTATWIFGGNLKVACDADLADFPWDTQECEIVLISTAASHTQMKFVKGDSGLVDLYYDENPEWVKERQEVEYGILDTEGGTFAFPKFSMSFTLKRQAKYYESYIILPCVILSTLTIFVFLIPSDAGEKVGLSITIQLSFVVFVFLMAEQIPTTSQVIPKIMVYLLVMMVHSTMATMAAVTVLMLHHHEGDANWFVRDCFIKPLLLCKWRKMKSRNNQTGPHCSHEQTDYMSNKNEDEKYKEEEKKIKEKDREYKKKYWKYLEDKKKKNEDEDNAGKDAKTAEFQCTKAEIEFLWAKIEYEKAEKAGKAVEDNSANEEIDYRRAAIILDRFYFWLFLLAEVLTAVICLDDGY